MPRYIKIKGKPGVLVEGPSVGAFPLERSYLGKAKKPVAPDAAPAKGHHVDRFEDVEQIVADDPWRLVRNACKDGDLELLGICVADDHAGAVAYFNKYAEPEQVAAAKKAEAEKAKAASDAADVAVQRAVEQAKAAKDAAKDAAAKAADAAVRAEKAAQAKAAKPEPETQAAQAAKKESA